MPSIQQLTAFAAATLLPLSLALPTTNSQPLQARSFSITQIRNKFFSEHNGHAARQRAVQKYTKNLLQESDDTTTSSATPKTNSFVATPGDADANPIDSTDLEYLTPVTINGKTYLIILDTGSSNFWIGGANTQARNKYSPVASKAIKGDSWKITYGDNTQAAGDVFSETVTIGETTVTSVAVGRATEAPSRFFLPGQNNEPGADGLLGLGFSAMSTFEPQQKTWFDTAVAQGLPNVFAADLRYGLEAGNYDFGQLNPANYIGEISYVDVVKSADPANQYWVVQPTDGDSGVMDTGTTLILLSSATTKKYYSSPAAVAAGARFNAQDQQWEFNCNKTLPDFAVGFGENQAVVPGDHLNYQNLGNGYCYSAIQNRADGMDFSIYGDRFLMTLYVVFDQRNGSPRIGFAAKPSAL